MKVDDNGCAASRSFELQLPLAPAESTPGLVPSTHDHESHIVCLIRSLACRSMASNKIHPLLAAHSRRKDLQRQLEIRDCIFGTFDSNSGRRFSV